MYRKCLLLAVLLLALIVPVWAQSGSLVAFVNNSGQLVVASMDGNTRWIVTNPGETLHPALGYSWSPDGRQLFFAVQQGDGSVSLRVGDVASQSAADIGQASGNLSGGDWAGNSVLVADGAQIGGYGSGGAAGLVQGSAALVSSFADRQPNLAVPANVSSQTLFYWQDGGYVLNVSGNPIALPGSQPDPRTRNSGLWSADGSLVAYSAYGDDGNTAVYVANTAGQTLTLSSGRTTPVFPEGWIANNPWLMYRDGAGQVRAADVGCLRSGCGDNPLANGAVLAPASATEVQAEGNAVFFRDGNSIRAVPLSCINDNSCLNSAVSIGEQAAPETILDVNGGTVVYTAYTQDAFNAADREIRVGSAGCLDCALATVIPGATAGLVSPDGRYVVADILGDGLYAVNLSDLTRVYLSGAGADVLKARWNG
jgi:hypothetical protein